MKKSYARLAFALLIYTLLVILWGAWVRISHSGDGCGDTWPLCQGRLIPEAERGKTWIEFAHRIMSGLYGWMVLFFYWHARKHFPKGSPFRRALGWTTIFMITEALLGAKLVLFKLVGTNDSFYRAFVMALHQVNSLLLMAATSLAFIYASHARSSEEMGTGGLWNRRTLILPAMFLTLAVTGAFASLAATLFPSTSLWEGFLADFAKDSHYLLKLRGWHPLLAICLGGSLCAVYWIQAQRAKTDVLKKAGGQAAFAMLVGIAFGISTLLALSPVWMKLTHLALAHVMWFFLIQFVWAFRKEKGEARLN